MLLENVMKNENKMAANAGGANQANMQQPGAQQQPDDDMDDEQYTEEGIIQQFN